MNGPAGIVEIGTADQERELLARADVEGTSTAALFATVLTALAASHLSYDSRTAASVVLPAAIFLALWIRPRVHAGAGLCRRAYGWAAVCCAVLSIAGIPLLIVLGPVSVVAGMTVVIAAWMRSIGLVVVSIVCATVTFIGMGGALAYAAEAPSINMMLCVGLLGGLGLAYLGYVHQPVPESRAVTARQR